MSSELYISMLGGFSIKQGDCVIDDSSNRMRKVWLLLAYLIYNRGKRTTQNQYLALICNSTGDEPEDPAGRLKALFYRVRTMLNQLGGSIGHDLIVHQKGNYGWNPNIPVTVDVEEFDRLCEEGTASQDSDRRLECFQQALALYQGDFLPKLSADSWVMPITAYYHQKYLNIAEQTLTLLEARELWKQADTLSAKAVSIEPYSETLYQHRMRCRLAQGDRDGVLSIYEEMSILLFETFGVMPSEESREIFREASREVNEQTVTIATVREQLREADRSKGALLCEYDFFRLLYQVQARAMLRSGDVVHIALLSLHSREKKPLVRRSLDRAMENLQLLVQNSLRQGDVLSRCSVSQLVVMLPQANYENSCMVCQRIVKAFERQYPHSPVQIRFSVQPLEPTIPENLIPR